MAWLKGRLPLQGGVTWDDSNLLGRTSAISVSFSFGDLLTDLGADESPSSVPFASLSFFLRAAAALILCLATSISTKYTNGRQEKQTLILDKLCKRFTYANGSTRLTSKLLATTQDLRNTSGGCRG